MVNKTPKVRRTVKSIYILPVLFVLGICCYLGRERGPHSVVPVLDPYALPLLSVPIGGLTANLFTASDQMHTSGNDLFIEFRDAGKNRADVGDVTLELQLKKPGMVMHSIGKVLRTTTSGQYRTTVAPQMAGDWVATLGFRGSHGMSETNFTLVVR
jgi:hypothetical protein